MRKDLRFLARRKKVLLLAKEKGARAILVTRPPNIFYLTGFWGDGALVLDDGNSFFYASSLEHERAVSQAASCDVRRVKYGVSPLEAARKSLTGKVVTDSRENLPIGKERGRSLLYENDVFLRTRAVKDLEERDLMRKAARVHDKLFERVAETMKAGLSERQVAASVIGAASQFGAYPPNHESVLSPLIVASGPNSRYPHVELGDRKIRNGDLVVVDIFLRLNGYFSDCTRTFAVGTLSKAQKMAWKAVEDAQSAAKEEVVEGVSASKVDQTARGLLTERNYGKYFIHSTGHGVGLEVHEAPWIRKASKDILTRGNVVTVEPGVYLDAGFGVRIEDTLLVNGKAESLTRFTHDLVNVG
jgi:Xaa-Pro aminopeptidase/Xaa-Pro dipeptidase